MLITTFQNSLFPFLGHCYREAEMREVSETTNARVAWFSIFSLGICILVSGLQLWYLKRFFRKKKLIQILLSYETYPHQIVFSSFRDDSNIVQFFFLWILSCVIGVCGLPLQGLCRNWRVWFVLGGNGMMVTGFDYLASTICMNSFVIMSLGKKHSQFKIFVANDFL